MLAAVAAFFGIAFGHLSRRFERQADVFGCTVVSCEHPDCPPHDDPDETTARPTHGRGVISPCPAGIRIFADALGRVAIHNGMEFRARSGATAASPAASRSSSRCGTIRPARGSSSLESAGSDSAGESFWSRRACWRWGPTPSRSHLDEVGMSDLLAHEGRDLATGDVSPCRVKTGGQRRPLAAETRLRAWEEIHYSPERSSGT